MNMKVYKQILAFFAITLMAVGASAQAKIDKVISELETQKTSQVTYTEKRDPKSKAITKMSLVIVCGNGAMTDKVRNAFKAERENSLEYSQTGDAIFEIKFLDKTGMVTTYSFVINENAFVLSKVKKQNRNKAYSFEFDFEDIDDCVNSAFVGDSVWIGVWEKNKEKYREKTEKKKKQRKEEKQKKNIRTVINT